MFLEVTFVFSMITLDFLCNANYDFSEKSCNAIIHTQAKSMGHIQSVKKMFFS